MRRCRLSVLKWELIEWQGTEFRLTGAKSQLCRLPHFLQAGKWKHHLPCGVTESEMRIHEVLVAVPDTEQALKCLLLLM